MAKLSIRLSSLLTDDIVMKLSTAGVWNAIDFVSQDPEHLTLKAGIPYKDVLSLRKILIAKFSSSILDGREVYDDIAQSATFLSTGCASVDELLDGGLCTMEMTEVVGSVAVGKTLFCIQLAVTTAQKHGQRVIYLDTGANFDVLRAHSILENANLSEQEMMEVLSRITHTQVYSSGEVLQELHHIREMIEKEVSDYDSCGVKLIILDNIASVITPILGGSSSEGHASMSLIAKNLKGLALDYSVAILVTNNMVSTLNQSLKPALGKTWLEIPDARILIEANKGIEISPHGGCQRQLTCPDLHVRTAKLIKTTKMEAGKEAHFRITDAGLESVT